MLKFLNRGISTPIAIGIIAVLVIIVGGGILAYQYYYIQKQEIKPPTTKEDNLQTTKLFIIPEKHGKPDRVFGSGIDPIFSPDNKRFAYVVGSEREKSFVVVDGNEHKTYDYIDPDSLIFSSDSKHFGYIAANDIEWEWPYQSMRPVGGRWWVIIDGIEQKEYSNICFGCFVFSADGKQFAYVASKSNDKISSNIVYAAGENPYYKEFVVLNGVEQKEYDKVYSPIFSPDNSRFAYIALQGRKHFLVLNGVEAEQNNTYDQIKYLSFSLDAQQIAYVAVKEFVGFKELMGVKLPCDAEFIVLNGIEQKQYESIDEVKFHLGGKFTYRGEDWERGFFLVMDNKEYANGARPVFSQNNNHFAYVVIAEDNNYMVLDGVPQQYRGEISPIVFSADGEHYIYAVQHNRSIKEFVVVDGMAQPERDANILFPIFSPDGKHFSYVAQQQNNQKVLVIMDGKELSQYDKVWEPRFTKDGKYLIYNALTGRDLWLIVNNVE